MSSPGVSLSGDVSGNEVRICVEGRGTFSVAQAMREFCIQALESGATSFSVEVGRCTYMDSTFIGVLALVSLRSRERSGSVRLLNTSEAVHEQLRGLGLKDLFEFAEGEPGAAGMKPIAPLPGASTGSLRDVMLEAHETLGEVDKDNIGRFRDVISRLKGE